MNGHKGSMSGSNVEDTTSEQTHGRETAPVTRARKEKSRDAIATMEARLAKLEVAMADTGCDSLLSKILSLVRSDSGQEKPEKESLRLL